MDLRTNCLNPYGLKDPVVKLERCDKIWKTLQLIRSMQDKHLEDIQDWIKREPIASENTMRKKPPMTFIPDKSLPLNLIGEPNLPRPHIKYQPIFNNGDESLPQFQLAEKSRVNSYHCEVCSKEYCNYKRFIDHRQEVHGIVMPKKVATKRERLQNRNNGEVKSRRVSAETNQPQTNKTLISDENVDLLTSKNSFQQADSIKCKLCSNYFKNIKKHMVDYHKIKCFAVLSKVTDQNSNLENDESFIEKSTLSEGAEKTADHTEQIVSRDADTRVQNVTNVLKRKISMPSIGIRKRLRSFSSREEESDPRNQIEQPKCNICGKEYGDHKALCKDRDRCKTRNEDGQSLESLDQESSRKANLEVEQDNDNDNNNIDHKIPRTRSSFTKERRRSVTLENGDIISLGHSRKKRWQIKCACGRSFRSTSILDTHKLDCKFLKDTSAFKPSDARTGSDRDSGISITIKKKNNSYEIVSKEGSDDEPLRNSREIEEPEICEETSDSSSDNSDSSEFDDQQENLIPEKSKYSADHCILKLELAEEDSYVDIEEELSEESPSVRPENNESNISLTDRHQVPLLRVLCKKFLIQRGIIPEEETSHKCQTCKIYLGSEEKLSKHIERHKKLMKRSCTCGIKFTALKAFEDHVASMHPNSIVCPYCKEKFKSMAGWGEHLCIVDQGAAYTEAFNENHPCPNCNIAFNNITWLESHMRSKHLDPNLPYQCYQCVEKFSDEIARTLHLHEKHNNVSSCSVCNRKFQSVKTKQKHEAYHRGVGFPCHNCKKTYRSKRNQFNHVRTVHSNFSNDKLKCFICQKSIKTKSFRKHVLKHTSILKCELCDKVVYDFRNLERHIIDHHSNENYPRNNCDVCGMSFPTKEQLEAHIMVEKAVKNDHYKGVSQEALR